MGRSQTPCRSLLWGSCRDTPLLCLVAPGAEVVALGSASCWAALPAGNGRSPEVSSPIHQGTPSPGGAQGIPPWAQLALLRHPPWWAAFGGPTHRYPSYPLQPGSGRALPPAAPHGSGRQNQRHTLTPTSCPPGLSPISFPSPLITPGSFFPRNPGRHSLALPLPHQCLSIVLQGSPTNYPVPSLRDRSPLRAHGQLHAAPATSRWPHGPAEFCPCAGPRRLNCR